MLTTYQLANLLQVSYRTAYRISILLHFKQTKQNNKLLHHFDSNHPLMLSASLLTGKAKPMYNIKQIASLWQWRKGSYSTERVRQLLDQFDIPIYNKSNKGLVYLSDLQKLLKIND